ncbi:hypothetical protein HOLleu_10841 [Holothuria leucospilota]|uniref:Integrase catalytic domain-containing protein n=1 Tax=Holothuria leucospilota TaxID=206669 RepID=A0A9Q1HF53_HOLLE|nr:hypothetical protein HOLleu_10841 [Holothuria leucospilota]
MKAESEWPVDCVSRDKITEDLHLEDPEVKKSASSNVVQSERSRIDELFERYSSWDDLKRGVAWLLRVKDFLRDRVRCKQASVKREPIAVEEYRRAEQEIAKYVQRQNFASIIVELQQESSKLKGVDNFGPMYVKQGRSQVRRYGCLFTCMSTRAVHIEISHSLDTDSFLNALRRFVARRGTPEVIFSNNGTNFVGERELREGIATFYNEKISKSLHQQEIRGVFNPSGASHMGCIWGRMVRSVKRVLYSLLKEQSVCDEALLTVMSEVEAILSSRPITTVTMGFIRRAFVAKPPIAPSAKWQLATSNLC